MAAYAADQYRESVQSSVYSTDSTYMPLSNILRDYPSVPEASSSNGNASGYHFPPTQNGTIPTSRYDPTFPSSARTPPERRSPREGQSSESDRFGPRLILMTILTCRGRQQLSYALIAFPISTRLDGFPRCLPEQPQAFSRRRPQCIRRLPRHSSLHRSYYLGCPPHSHSRGDFRNPREPATFIGCVSGLIL